jgi:2-polyprenyl-6-methoxyphenol hydroxylase-like FAD-dependent oxidoreductase
MTSPTLSRRRTLIVGGGLAGLTLAAALKQQGVDAQLVEREDQWRALGAGLMVQANGMRVLRRLGIDAAVRSAGVAVRRWAFTDQLGDVLFEIDLQALWGDVGPCIGIARASLQRVLVQAADGVQIRLGTSITALEEDEEKVAVTFTDGSTGIYDLVVGADGIDSAVRQHACNSDAPSYTEQVAWRSLAPIRLPGPASVEFWLGDGCFFGLCSVGDGQTYGFGYAAAERHRDPVSGRLERLRARFADFGDHVQEYLRRLQTDEQIHCSSIRWIEQEQWHTRRVVLIGDAAHASSPMMGQGGCLAIEDAIVLAESLDAAPTIQSALVAYAERRRDRINWVKRESQAVGESLRLAPQVRNPALREQGARMFDRRFRPLLEHP